MYKAQVELEKKLLLERVEWDKEKKISFWNRIRKVKLGK